MNDYDRKRKEKEKKYKEEREQFYLDEVQKLKVSHKDKVAAMVDRIEWLEYNMLQVKYRAEKRCRKDVEKM